MEMFRIDHVVGRARCGVLRSMTRPDTQIATPACLLYTRNGVVPHLTPDMVATLPPQAAASTSVQASYVQLD